MTLADAELRVTNPRLAITELNGAIALNRDRLVMEDVAGIANGGSLTIDGEVHYPALQIVDGEVSIVGRNIALNVPTGLRTEVNTDLTLEIEPDQMALGGTVTVLRGDYRDPLSLTTGLLAALRSRAEVTVIGERSVLDDVRLNMRVRTSEDIIVDNNYANAELGADVQLIGTLGAPAIAGRVAIREGGEIFNGNNIYEIESGAIDFTNPSEIEPDLSVSARTQISEYDITLTLAGTPATMEADLSSSPPLSEPDIISVLLTGRTLDEAGGAAGVIARDQALGLVSGELLGRAGRVVGLDTLRVDQAAGGRDVRFDSSLVASEIDPGARLTFGKNVSRDVQLVFSQSLKDSGSLIWIVDYEPRRNLELRGVVLDNNDRSYEFRHAVSFGGSGSGPSVGGSVTRDRGARESRRIDSLQFSGTSGVSDEELRARLTLTEGDRFDFHQWQRDQDRLEEFFHQRGYWQAHLRARRTEGNEDTIALTYEIDGGPQTTLIVAGYDLPSRLRREMEQAWSQSVFDGFLTDELQRIAAVHLAGRGYLRATVTTEVVARSDVNDKQIVLTIDPGLRTIQPRLTFRGNAHIPSEALERHLAALDLTAIAWVDRSQAVEALRGLYRSQGWLGARVTVGDPTFEADAAELPIAVVEGPLYRMSSVTLDGVRTRPAAEVRAALALGVGDRYTEAAAQAARVRLNGSYRNAGFNAANVTISTAIDEVTGTADVTVRVEEGPRQVLEDIAVAGARLTNPGVISQALRLTPGEPVDLESWFQARRRLYSSGVFRSVTIDPEPAGAPVETDAGTMQAVRAQVTLEEWPPYRLRYGVQLVDINSPLSETGDRTLKPGLAGDLTRQNLFGRAVTVGASVRYNTLQRATRGFLRLPTLWGLPVTTSLFASRTREEPRGVLPFVKNVSDVTAEQRFRPAPNLVVAYSYNYQRNRTFRKGLDPRDPFGFDLTVNIARLNTTTVYDTRNDFFDATRGFFHSSSIEYAPEALGSELRFVKYLAQQSYFRSLPHGIVIASAARLGLGKGFDQELVAGEPFLAGGGNSVRGYAEDSLGPTDFFGPVGGDALLVFNQEVRFPLIRPVRGVAFFDAGNVFAAVRDISLTDLRMGVGLGLRIETPFALLRADYGARIRRSSREPFGRWFFSIGHAF